MSISVRIVRCTSESERRDAFSIRHDVFVAEQNVPAHLELDEYDDHAIHLLALDAQDAPLGTARIVTKRGGIAKIGRVAVQRDARGAGVGGALMRTALQVAADTGLQVAVLDAQTHVLPFYERIGFVADGGEFDDAGIPHRRMNRELHGESGFPRLRAAFPSAEKCIHLNHAGTAPAPDVCNDAILEVMHDMQSSDSFSAYIRHMPRQEYLRGIIARMLHVTPETVAFVKNTSHGIAIMAQTIPFAPGQNVVISESEYPANVYPWLSQGHRGVEVKRVPTRENGIVEEDDLLAACDSNTKALTVSSVQWGTGQAMDLQYLGDACRARGILFCVDMVQGFGQREYRMAELPVDMATAGCHKWMLCPTGIGILYVRPGLIPDLLPTNFGWNSVVNPTDWETMHYDQLKPNADRYEEGSPGLLATAALEASLSLVESVGFTQIYSRIFELATLIRTELAARGMQVISPAEPPRQTGIVAFRHPTRSNADVLATLKSANVLAAVRCGNLRFSPYAYLTEDEILHALSLL